MKPIITLTLNPAIDQVIELDRLVVGSMNRALTSRPMTGGKGINVARVLKGFGMEVLTAGFSAGNGTGMIHRTLEAEGIPAHFIEVPGEVRVNLKIHDASDGKTTEINQPGFKVDGDAADRLMSRVESLLEIGSALVLTGSLPAGMPRTAYLKLAQLAWNRNIPVFLDADGENLEMGLSGQPYAVKPNRDELERYAGSRMEADSDWVHAMRKFRESGAECIAATMGPGGVMMLDGDTAWHAGGLPIVPACATGAGDSTLAAMIYGWHHRLPPQRIAALMSAAGGMTAARPGLSFCTLCEMLESADTVVVRHIPSCPE